MSQRSSERTYAFGEAPWHSALPSSSSSQGVFGAVRSFVGSFTGSFALPTPLALAVPIVAIILIIVLAVTIVGAVQSCTAPAEQAADQVEAAQPLTIDYTPSIAAFDSLTDPGETVTGFTLAAEGASYQPTLGSDNAAAIQAALDVFAENDRTIGFVFIDLESGSGYCYNIDEKVYGASSFKGPVFIYGCQESLEPGILSMSTVNSYCENAIVWSDNTSYYRMRNYFEDYGEVSLETWLANMNISTSLANDTSFPHYCARDSIKLWMNTYLYFESDDSDEDIVAWAQDFFGRTEVSMIRAGVDPSSVEDGDESEDEGMSVAEQIESFIATGSASPDGPEITVYNKAGWINGTTDDALCDAGIIIADGKPYLMSIMTSVPDSESNRDAVSDLAAALWGARMTLVPEQGMVTPAEAEASSDGDSASADASNTAQA